MEPGSTPSSSSSSTTAPPTTATTAASSSSSGTAPVEILRPGMLANRTASSSKRKFLLPTKKKKGSLKKGSKQGKKAKQRQPVPKKSTPPVEKTPKEPEQTKEIPTTRPPKKVTFAPPPVPEPVPQNLGQETDDDESNDEEDGANEDDDDDDDSPEEKEEDNEFDDMNPDTSKHQAVEKEKKTNDISRILKQNASNLASASLSASTALVADTSIETSMVEKKKKKKGLEGTELSKLQMNAFTRNRKNGKPAPSRVRRQERLKKQRAEKRRLKRLGIEVIPESTNLLQEEEAEEEEEAAAPRPQVEYINGVYQVKQDSLVYRHKKTSDIRSRPVSDIDETSRRITSLSYTKKKVGVRWTDDETKMFYYALRQCGQDFTLLAHFFPNRDRRQVRQKFKREEKNHPALVQKALVAKIPLSLDETLTQKCNEIGTAFKEEGIAVPDKLDEAIAHCDVVIKAMSADSSPSKTADNPAKKKKTKGNGKRKKPPGSSAQEESAVTKKKPKQPVETTDN